MNNNLLSTFRNCRLFYFGFFLYFFSRYLEYTTFNSIHTFSILLLLIKNLSYGIFMAIILIYLLKNCRMIIKFYKDKPNKFLLMIVFFVFLFYQVVKIKSNVLFVVTLISCSYYAESQYNQPLKDFIRFNFFLHLIFFVVVVLFCNLGLIENVYREEEKMGYEIVRQSLGFTYPGQLQMQLLPLILMYCYLKRDDLRVINIIISIFFISFVFLYSQTIMPFIIEILSIIFFKFRYILSKLKPAVVNSHIIFLTLTCVLTAYVYFGLPCSSFLDTVVNHRFSLNITGISKYGITLLGTGFKNINEQNGEYLYLDSEYMFILVSNGLVYLVFLMYLLKKFMISLFDGVQFELIFIFFVYFVYAIVNNGILDLIISPFSIIILYPFIKSNVYLTNKSNDYY